MQHLRHAAVVLTATVFLGARAGLAAEPEASAPTELEFGPQCEPIKIQVPRPIVTWPRFSRENPGRPAPYPARSRKRAEHGTLKMRLLVNEQGRVTRAQLVESTGYPTLDRVGLEGTRKWKLTPGTIDGNAQSMWENFSVTWASPHQAAD